MELTRRSFKELIASADTATSVVVVVASSKSTVNPPVPLTTAVSPMKKLRSFCPSAFSALGLLNAMLTLRVSLASNV